MSRSTVVVLGLLFGIAKAGSVFAQEAPPPKEEVFGNDEAMAQFKQGVEFFNQAQFEKAAIAMKRAYELRPGYKILYYLGLAESETGNYSRALKAYTQYLEEAPRDQEEERILEIEREVKKLRVRVGALRIVCGVDGAKVKVDNEVFGIVPLKEPIPVDIGRHEVTITDGASEIYKEVIRIAGEQEITIEVGNRTGPTTVANEPPITPQQEPQKHEVSDVRPKKSKGRIAAFALLGGAAAVAVGAVITGALALDQEGEIWDRCDADGNCFSEDYDGNFEDDQYRLRTLGIAADVLIGVASTAAVAGTVLLVVSRGKHKKETAAGRFSPSVAPGAFGVFVSGRF